MQLNVYNISHMLRSLDPLYPFIYNSDGSQAALAIGTRQRLESTFPLYIQKRNKIILKQKSLSSYPLFNNPCQIPCLLILRPSLLILLKLKFKYWYLLYVKIRIAKFIALKPIGSSNPKTQAPTRTTSLKTVPPHQSSTSATGKERKAHKPINNQKVKRKLKLKIKKCTNNTNNNEKLNQPSFKLSIQKINIQNYYKFRFVAPLTKGKTQQYPQPINHQLP